MPVPSDAEREHGGRRLPAGHAVGSWTSAAGARRRVGRERRAERDDERRRRAQAPPGVERGRSA